MSHFRQVTEKPLREPSTTESPALAAPWARNALAGLARRAQSYLARSWAADMHDAAAEDEPMRFMNDVSGGGFRTREAARSLRRAQAPDSPAGDSRPPDPAVWLFF
jgi:hypothetical protein